MLDNCVAVSLLPSTNFTLLIANRCTNVLIILHIYKSKAELTQFVVYENIYKLRIYANC